MRTSAADLLPAILDPATDCDAVRLAYSDLLEEAGEVERASFIRVQLEIDKRLGYAPAFEQLWSDELRARVAALRRRERELLRGAETDPACHGANSWAWAGPCNRAEDWQWRRGFVSGVRCSSPSWLAHAGAILAAHPVREVTLTTVPSPGQLRDEYWKMDWMEGSLRVAARTCLECLRDLWPRVRTWHLPGRPVE